MANKGKRRNKYMTLLGMFAKAIRTYQDNESFDIIEIQHSNKEYEYITVNSADIINQKNYIQQKCMNHCYSCYHFIQSRVGNAVLIYAVRTYKVKVFDWEKEIADALNLFLSDSHKKNVNVEFKINKITSTGKMNARNLKDILIHNASIDEYNFSTNSEGVAVMMRLGSVSYLTCENISKISYGCKTLYERKDEITK